MKAHVDVGAGEDLRVGGLFSKRGHKKTIKDTVVVISTDLDDCIFNSEYHRSFPSKIGENLVVTKNPGFFNYISTLVSDSCSKVVCNVGSARQSLTQDVKRIKNQDEVIKGGQAQFGSESLVSAISSIYHELKRRLGFKCKVELNKSLLTDDYHDRPDGTTFNNIKRFNEINEIDEAMHIHDENKFSLLYKQMQQASLANPDKKIEFYFFDDRKDILLKLHQFFLKNKRFIPENIKLNLRIYNDKNKTPSDKIDFYNLAPIQGEGAANPHYRKMLNYFVRMLAISELKEKINKIEREFNHPHPASQDLVEKKDEDNHCDFSEYIKLKTEFDKLKKEFRKLTQTQSSSSSSNLIEIDDVSNKEKEPKEFTRSFCAIDGLNKNPEVLNEFKSQHCPLYQALKGANRYLTKRSTETSAFLSHTFNSYSGKDYFLRRKSFKKILCKMRYGYEIVASNSSKPFKGKLEEGKIYINSVSKDEFRMKKIKAAELTNELKEQARHCMTALLIERDDKGFSMYGLVNGTWAERKITTKLPQPQPQLLQPDLFIEDTTEESDTLTTESSIESVDKISSEFIKPKPKLSHVDYNFHTLKNDFGQKKQKPDSELMSALLKGHVPVSGFEYQVIDPGGEPRNMFIPRNELPKDFPKKASEILESEYLETLLNMTQKLNHTKLESAIMSPPNTVEKIESLQAVIRTEANKFNGGKRKDYYGSLMKLEQAIPDLMYHSQKEKEFIEKRITQYDKIYECMSVYRDSGIKILQHGSFFFNTVKQFLYDCLQAAFSNYRNAFESLPILEKDDFPKPQVEKCLEHNNFMADSPEGFRCSRYSGG